MPPLSSGPGEPITWYHLLSLQLGSSPKIPHPDAAYSALTSERISPTNKGTRGTHTPPTQENTLSNSTGVVTGNL